MNVSSLEVEENQAVAGGGAITWMWVWSKTSEKYECPLNFNLPQTATDEMNNFLISLEFSGKVPKVFSSCGPEEEKTAGTQMKGFVCLVFCFHFPVFAATSLVVCHWLKIQNNFSFSTLMEEFRLCCGFVILRTLWAERGRSQVEFVWWQRGNKVLRLPNDGILGYFCCSIK